MVRDPTARSSTSAAKAPLACVTKSISINSPAAHCKPAQDAIASEWAKIEKYHALDLANPREWEDVKKEDPEATVVPTAMLLGIKHSELPEDQQVWKARFIALGNQQRTIFGQSSLRLSFM